VFLGQGHLQRKLTLHYKVPLCVEKFFMVIGSASYTCIFKIIYFNLHLKSLVIVVKSETTLTLRSLLQLIILEKTFFM